jgi:D-sedoheptulose 7-phosphate isomerase
MKFIQEYLIDCCHILKQLDTNVIHQFIQILCVTRAAHGRLFILGVGGSAANASHAVSDFRKIAQIQAYAPTDNIAELTARTNDNGWETTFADWLHVSRLEPRDAVLVFSVGGGDADKNISPNIVAALKYAKPIGAKIMGIVSRDGGYTADVADACLLIPVINHKTITPHAEALQGVIWHLLVSHPALQPIVIAEPQLAMDLVGA